MKAELYFSLPGDAQEQGWENYGPGVLMQPVKLSSSPYQT